MSAIASGFSDLRLESQSKTVTTTVQSDSEARNHVEELQTEIRQMTRTMSNPIYRVGYEAGFNEALNKLAEFISSSNGDRSTMISSSIPIKGFVEPIPDDTQRPDLETGREGDADKRKTVVGSQMAVARTPIGVFHLHSRKLRVTKASSRIDALSSTLEGFEEYQTSLRYHPAQWLMRWNLMTSGLDVSLSSSIQGWKNTLRTFRAVPDNAPIFEFCRTGNFNAARTLFSSGQASPMDTNSLGWTPLHVNMPLLALNLKSLMNTPVCSL